MASILEAGLVAYDSDIIKPDLTEKVLKNREVRLWLGKKPIERFSLPTVEKALGIIIDSFNTENSIPLNPIDESKLNFSITVFEDVATNGRKAVLYKIMENLKTGALKKLTENEQTVENLVSANQETIDELVTMQVISFFFEDIDRRYDNKGKSGKNNIRFSQN